MTTWRSHAAAKPAVFTIPPDAPFVDALARGIFDDAGDDPLALVAITILLPTRRACRSLREAFLRLSNGKPLLLPRLVPLSDMDEDEAILTSFAGTAEATTHLAPPIAPLRRQLMLARLIQKSHIGYSPEQAVRLAQELARLLDQVQNEQLPFAKLQDLVGDDYAEHWQITLAFLKIVTEHWPNILAAEGALDPAQHRNAVFAAQTGAWARGEATGPVIAAGSTGSIPATAELLKTVAAMRDGCVVLPGLDQGLDADAWDAVDDTHPQYGLKQLLHRIGIGRAAVQLWPAAAAPPSDRVRLVSEVMRPAATTDTWRHLKDLSSKATEGLTRLECATPREEAEAIALIMREAAETADRTCALVTPDRALAQRVAAELKRWKIDIDDSGGQPLAQTPPGALLRLVAAMVADDFAPVGTLAVCKHPLSASGLDPVDFRALTREAEIALLRGPKPPAGLIGLRQLAGALKSPRKEIERWIGLLESCCGAFAAVMAQESASLAALLAAHMEAAEAMAASHDLPGPLRLWAGDAGEVAATFAAELAQSADVAELIAPARYPALFDALMNGQVVRPRYGRHPRLAILGPLEARLQRYDVMILGGLNEGTWPADATVDPWMSRPMRKAFGLPSPERRIGLAAHDIAQALCSPRVVLTRARKVDGTPTVPSRWLMRLERVVAAADLADTLTEGSWASWTAELTRPDKIAAVTPPAPKPPLAARPRRLSVTEVERWMRDPYSIYARHILKLRPLDPLEQDASVADYGSLIHATLQRFIAAYAAGPLPANAEDLLLTIGREYFGEGAVRPSVMAFWWPRFERIAAWFITHENERRRTLAQSFVEVGGEMKLAGPGGDFTLVAKADRIDRSKDNRLTIIDYKTGTLPKAKEVLAGFSPQLPLEAAIAAAHGFGGVPAAPIDTLSFWHLHGRKDGGDEIPVKGDIAALAAEARAGLARLIAAFDDVKTAYEARPNPELAPAYSDYLHLARVKEWAASGEDEN